MEHAEPSPSAPAPHLAIRSKRRDQIKIGIACLLIEAVLMDAINDLRLTLLRGCSHEKTCELLNHFTEFARKCAASLAKTPSFRPDLRR